MKLDDLHILRPVKDSIGEKTLHNYANTSKEDVTSAS